MIDTKIVLHYLRVMTRALKNVTLTIEEPLLRLARIRAAEEDKSLSLFLADALRDKLSDDTAYRAAMTDFLKQQPILSTGGVSLPKRSELYDRKLFR